MNDPTPTVFVQTRKPSTNDAALVTVAVSLYNYEGEIEACLNSVKAQDHLRLELVVVDDASTDNSAAVAEAWLKLNADRFERVMLLRQTINQGLSAARNLAFDAALADYVFVLDADNVIYPAAISRLLDVIQSTGAAATYSQLVYFGEQSGLGVANTWRAESFETDNYIDAMALIRKSAWAEVGGYSPIDYGWEDYDLWCKFVEADLQGVYVPEPLCKYRVHKDSMRLTDTQMERARLVHGMMGAHPWLKLKVS